MKYNQTLFTIIDLFNHLVTIYLVFLSENACFYRISNSDNWGVLSNVNV